MSGEIIRSDAMWLRMTDLEYKNLTEEEYKQEIERIYLEEYGEKLPADINIFPSSKAPDLKEDDSGYQGTAVHFQSEEQSIDEVYVISQGTDDIQDWEYNSNAMLAGKDAEQAEATKTFVSNSKEHFKIDNTTNVAGLSHSLAVNNNITAHFLNDGDTFDSIYGVNGAQANYYQLFNNDDEFQDIVKNEFNIKSNAEIYNVDPEIMKAFTEEYYKQDSQNIQQIISKDDPLYAVSNVRGFVQMGNVMELETNPDKGSLRDIMNDIPDENVAELQNLAIQYAEATENGEAYDGLQEVTGVDMKLINQLQDSPFSTYVSHQQELDQMVNDMHEKVPDVLVQINQVTNNSEDIFQRFVDEGYINSKQKNTIVHELTNIEQELDKAEKTIATWDSLRNSEPGSVPGVYPGSVQSSKTGADIGAYMTFVNQIGPSLEKSLQSLQQTNVLDNMSEIVQEHSIQSVLEKVSKGNRSYQGGDMLWTSPKKSGGIQVNISAAMRLYDKGISLLEDKKEEIKRLETAVDREIKNHYQQEKRAIRQRIDEIEANPKAYSFFLDKHLPLSGTGHKEVKQIQVLEEINPLKKADMEDHVNKLRESVEEGEDLIETYRSSIEDLFDEEENVSGMFDLAEEVLE